MTQHFRLVILESELPSEDIHRQYGSYADIVLDGLRRTIKSDQGRRTTLSATKRSVLDQDELPEWDQIDGLIILGSKYSAWEDGPGVQALMRIIKEAYIMHKPLVGICFGHQIIGRALGGMVSLNPGGWELGVQPMHLSKTGRQLFGVERLAIHQMHQDAVVRLPPDVNIENVASSPVCQVQMMYQPGRILTLQGHPEFNARVSGSWLEQRYDEGEFGEKMYEEARETLESRHDGPALLAAICRFLLGT